MVIISDAPTRTPEEATADALAGEAREVWQRIVASYNDASLFFWANPSGLAPQAIADALGTKGKDVFQLHYRLGEFIASIKPEAIAKGLEVVGAFSYREDGSVEVTPKSPKTEPTKKEFAERAPRRATR